jgi:altered-inheritance-of-mitochondria protein 5
LPDGSYSPRPSLEQYSDHRKGDSSFLETAKSRWNAEVASAVHWAQTKDWAAVREDAEENVSRLLGLSLSRESSDTAIVRQDPARPAAVPPVEAAQRTPAAPVYSASPAATPSPKAADTLHDAGARVAEAAQAVNEEAKGAVSRGIEKAQDLVGKAKAAVYLAEEKAEAKIDAKLLHVSDVERALQERYDSARREERMKRSVQEVLAERYTPIGESDNSRLRGL